MVAAFANLGVADQQVGHVNGRGDVGLIAGSLRDMMILDDFNKRFRQALFSEVHGAQLSVIHPQDFPLQVHEVFAFLGALMINLVKMVWKGRGHDDLAHIVNEAGDVIDFGIIALEQIGDLAGHQRGGDAVPPELAPRESVTLGQFLKILNDGRDHGELADLADAQVEDRLLNVSDRFGHAVIDGVDQAQQAGGQAGIAPDDFGDLGRVALVGAQQFPQRRINRA